MTPPRVARVNANFISPVSATNSYRLTVQFDSSMDPTVEPVVNFTSTGAVAPTVLQGGMWLTTTYPNDTYTTADIVLSVGMDGDVHTSVSGARDFAGNLMDPNPQLDVYTFSVNASAPNNPTLQIVTTACDSVTVAWPGYITPVDLAAYQLYVDTAPFSSVDGISYQRLLNATDTSAVISNLVPGQQYYVAVVAMDTVGNITSTVSSLPVLINEPVPPPVLPQVGGGGTATSAQIDWSGYGAANLCGFDGFAVYQQSSNFTSVGSLTPIAILGADEVSLTVQGLSRSQIYYFAVVGINASGQFDSNVTAVPWTDPFAGVISVDTVMGGGAETEVLVPQSLVIRNGATLTIEPGTTVRFATGSGLTIEDGKLIADGTAFEPVLLTSENDVTGGQPLPGQWAGVLISSGDTGSRLSEVRLHYGGGLEVSGSGPTVTAFTAMYTTARAGDEWR
jgi:hypothetical protein